MLEVLKSSSALKFRALSCFCCSWVTCCRVGGSRVSSSLRSGKRKALPLSHEVQSRPPSFLNSSSKRSLGAAGSTPRTRLGQRFMSEGLEMWPLTRVNVCLSEPSQGLSPKQCHKAEAMGNLFKRQGSQIQDCRG